MVVREIIADAKDFLGNCDTPTALWFITEALQLLNNKSEWDVLKAYIDLPVQSNNIVTLPEFVDVPLKATIGGNPSFSRDRLYEFSINGPGPTATRTTFGWEDRGFVPTLIQLPSASRLIISLSAADTGKKITIVGLDASNNELQETLVIAASNVSSTNTFAKLVSISKDATTNPISLYTTPDGSTLGTLLSIYKSYETEPRYRQIILSDTGETVRLLVRRKTFAVTSLDDFVPVVNKLAMLLMIKAIRAYKRDNPSDAKGYEDQAARIATEAQRATTTFIDLAKDTEMDSARGYNYLNRDSIIVSDIYDDVAKIVGPIGQRDIFDKITEGLEALNNKGDWDGLVGYVDIFTDGGSYVTLPRYVESPMAVNLGGSPKFMRSKWCEFHLNGPGSLSPVHSKAWDYIGDVVTQQPLNYDVQLIAIPDSAGDNAKAITIYGYDENGKWIRTNGVDGFTVLVDQAKVLPLVGDQKVSRIERIKREATTGFVRLTGYSLDQTQSVQLGYWYPDETEPQYTRIKLPQLSNWVRMRYRKRTMKVSSVNDPLHLKSKIAIVTMIRSLEAMQKPDGLEMAKALKKEAVEYLEDEQRSRNPGETFTVQFGPGSWDSGYILV